MQRIFSLTKVKILIKNKYRHKPAFCLCMNCCKDCYDRKRKPKKKEKAEISSSKIFNYGSNNIKKHKTDG